MLKYGRAPGGHGLLPGPSSTEPSTGLGRAQGAVGARLVVPCGSLGRSLGLWGPRRFPLKGPLKTVWRDVGGHRGRLGVALQQPPQL